MHSFPAAVESVPVQGQQQPAVVIHADGRRLLQVQPREHSSIVRRRSRLVDRRGHHPRAVYLERRWQSAVDHRSRELSHHRSLAADAHPPHPTSRALLPAPVFPRKARSDESRAAPFPCAPRPCLADPTGGDFCPLVRSELRQSSRNALRLGKCRPADARGGPVPVVVWRSTDVTCRATGKASRAQLISNL